MIIDSHAHMEKFTSGDIEDTAEKVLRYMDMAGIGTACVSTYSNLPGANEDIFAYYDYCCKKYPGKFIPFIRLDPGYGNKAIDMLEIAVKKYNFRGVKLHPIDYSRAPFEENTIKILKKAGEYDIPVLYHCSDEIMCLPLQIEWAAEACKETKIILGHMGGFFHQDDAINIAKRNANVYLETCEQPYIKGIIKAVREVGPERILFGTDMPTDNPMLEVEKIKMAGLGKDVENMIFYNNISTLLKIKEVQQR